MRRPQHQNRPIMKPVRHSFTCPKGDTIGLSEPEDHYLGPPSDTDQE